MVRLQKIKLEGVALKMTHGYVMMMRGMDMAMMPMPTILRASAQMF